MSEIGKKKLSEKLTLVEKRWKKFPIKLQKKIRKNVANSWVEKMSEKIFSLIKKIYKDGKKIQTEEGETKMTGQTSEKY